MNHGTLLAPAETRKRTPQAFASGVRDVTTSGKSIPLSRPLTSGMPLPAARGDTKQTRAPATQASQVQNKA